MKKTWSLLLCLTLLCGCSSAPSQNNPADQTDPSRQEEQPADQNEEKPVLNENSVSDEEFEKFLDQYVIDVCENDYSNAHHYFEDPEAYGIDVSKADITLGTFVATDKDKEFTNSILTKLKEWDPESLNDTNSEIYRQLEWMYTIESDSNAARYDYVAPIWSEMSGVQSNLTDFFSEYQLFTKDDVEPLIKLINDTPRYVQEALDYSKEQANRGMLRLDLDTVVTYCENILSSQDDSPITKELDDEVDGLLLEKSEGEEIKEKIHKALADSLFPSYQTIVDGLKALEDDILPIEGMAKYSSGKDYYTLLLRHYTGTSQTPQEIYSNVYAAMNDASAEYRQIVKKNSKAAEDADDPKTKFKEVSEIMPFLEEKYASKFPTVETMNYEVKPLTNEQSKNGVVAYFVVPPIDSERTYEIRYNERDYGGDPSALSLYSTFAHEGIPGHMYQTQYEKEHFTQTAQYFLSSMGMQEGYAVYSAFQSYDWTGIDSDVLTINRLSELYSNYMVLIMDLQINYEGMSLDEFNEKWGGSFDSLYYQLAENPGVFFAYHYGYYMINKMYTDAKDTLGSRFNEVEFNNALLKAGNVAFDIVKENIDEYVDDAQ